MPELLTPGVYFQKADPPVAATALRTDVPAFLGLAERGPVHVPVRLSSFDQFRTVFGDFVAEGLMAYAAKAFFENGGRTAYFVRIAAGEVGTTLDLGASQPADRLASVVESADGFVPGAAVTLFQAPDVVATMLLQSVDGPAETLTWDRPVPAAFDLTAPVTLTTGAGAAQAAVWGAGAEPSLEVRAASAGVWGDRLEVQVSRSVPAAVESAAGPQPADGSGTYVRSTVGFTRGSLVRLFQAPALEAHAVVRGVDALDGRLDWETDLLALGLDPTAAIHLEVLEFGLTVYLDGRPREQWSGLSMVDTHPRYVGERLAPGASLLVWVKDLLSTDPPEVRLPKAGPRRRLAGGRDGLAALTVDDWTGEPGHPERWGLRTLELEDEPALLAAPDLHVRPEPTPQFDRPAPPEPDPCLPGEPPEPVAAPPPPPIREQPPELGLGEIFAVQQAMVHHCETQRDRIALLDPPRGTSESAVGGDLEEVRGWRQRFDTSYAALFHPWIVVTDPRPRTTTPAKALPPSGHVAGLYAHTDLTLGVHHPPANQALRWAVGLTQNHDDGIHGVLNPLGINALRNLGGRGLRIYGARTMSSDTAWRFVNVRRLMLMIEESLKSGLQWTVFEPHDVVLRQKIILVVTTFLSSLADRGALRGDGADTSFFVKCDEENNPPEVVSAGQLLCEIGVAPVRPAEFVIVRIGRTQDGLELTEV